MRVRVGPRVRAEARFRARVKGPRVSTVSISAIEVAMGSDLPHAAAMLPRAPAAAPTDGVVPTRDVVPTGGVEPTGAPRAAGAHQASRAAVRSAARAAA